MAENLFLTPTSAIINLRPQLHHMDALADLERRREAAAANAEKAASGQQPGRAIHMTIKTEGNEVTTETMADRIRAVQSEKWVHLGYVDDNNDRAWETYEENLIIKADTAVPGLDPKGKAPVLPAEGDELVEKMPYLQMKMQNMEDLLYIISGRERPIDEDVQEVKPEHGMDPPKGTSTGNKK